MNRAEHHIYCNGISPPNDNTSDDTHTISLEWRTNARSTNNINLDLPGFIDRLGHLPHRILDLLEIAVYIYSADRWIKRGTPLAVEYHSWSRNLVFHIKVRDLEFWSRHDVTKSLESCLIFMAGDARISFKFRGGHKTPPTSLFDFPQSQIEVSRPTDVILFSGGLDSLAGAISALETTSNDICLVSHQSNSMTAHTQKTLCKALASSYPNRVLSYSFKCSLHKIRAAEESQRSRSFLYSAIAFAVARAIGNDEFYFYENGFTSLGLPERQDLMNARASRTTHPKTIRLLYDFLTLVNSSAFRINTPFQWKTKADVFRILKKHSLESLISSSVSCSHTRYKKSQYTHCGECSQCVERRLAAYAAHVNAYDSDSGIYKFDLITEPLADKQARTTLIDYIRNARDLACMTAEQFESEKLGHLVDVVEGISAEYSESIIERTWELCQQHGRETLYALRNILFICDDMSIRPREDSLLALIAQREYLKTPVLRLVERVSALLSPALPLAFQTEKPKNEKVLNDKIEALVEANRQDFDREFPTVRFALARAVPDHSIANEDLFIETKFIRGKTTPSVVSEGIAADITKYPVSKHIQFIIYDPERAIRHDNDFRIDFEKKGRCTITIVR